jgi:hypothetical protein
MNYEMDTSKKMVAIAGKTSSTALLEDNPSDTNCLLGLNPFFQVRKDGELLHSTMLSSEEVVSSKDGLSGMFTEIVAIKFPTYLSLKDSVSVTNSLYLAVVVKFEHLYYPGE